MSPYSSDEDNDNYSNRTSIFSAKPSTVSTRPSTVPSRNSSSYASSSNPASKIGRSLRTTHTENLQQDTYNLKILSESLTQHLDQFDSKTPILITEALNKFETPLQPSNFNSSENKTYINNIVRVILTLADNILANNETYRTSRFMVLKSFHLFALRCNFLGPDDISTRSGMGSHNIVSDNNMIVPEPLNFCLVDEGDTKISQILDTIACSDSSVITDQEGSFLAPVARGISESLSIPTIVCGFPKPKPEHYEQVKQLCSMFNDIHFVVQKNYIKTCASAAGPAAATPPAGPTPAKSTGSKATSPFIAPNTQFNNFGGIIPPFRIPQDSNNIPISLSIAANSDSKLSGTLGGYLYPKIDVKKNNFLAEDAKATYAMTCAHVCIDDSTSHPYVSVPSPVLIKLYKEALSKERNKYPDYSQEYKGYHSALRYLEQKFPPTDGTKNIVGNGSSSAFGRVIFGERSIVNGRLSDIAIIKCNPNITCMNHLGTDFPFSQYDPALMFGNLQIKKVISKIKPGSQVFKFGSTTKFTSGKLNKPKLVYWADNRIQSSEFVIASDKPSFAAGGDSGAWILQKLEDFEMTGNSAPPDPNATSSTSDSNNNNSTGTSANSNSKNSLGTIYESNQSTKNNSQGTASSTANISASDNNSKVQSGLGVVGMLHAYDGEFKQFGLYSPIVLILNRLHELTKVPWGIVGVLDEDNVKYNSTPGENADDDDEASESSEEYNTGEYDEDEYEDDYEEDEEEEAVAVTKGDGKNEAEKEGKRKISGDEGRPYSSRAAIAATF